MTVSVEHKLRTDACTRVQFVTVLLLCCWEPYCNCVVRNCIIVVLLEIVL
jgi:hypothetical protein